jgi:hypothetical protein
MELTAQLHTNLVLIKGQMRHTLNHLQPFGHYADLHTPGRMGARACRICA